MPETLFHMRWPDGSREVCYSPSSIIERHLEVGHEYRVAEFLDACRRGLQAASDRVGAVYGRGGCARAMAQLTAIEARLEGHADGIVRVERFTSSDARLRA